MVPVKKPKQTQNKSPKKNKKTKDIEKMAVESVVSGQLQKKITKKQQQQKPIKDRKGVVFIKSLPHGFFEDQLKTYFEQFGTVTRVRLSRSRLTGRSKGYAFVEFEYPEVAEVAAETMDNYLMFNKIVKAAYIPPEKQTYNYFKSTIKQIRKRKFGKNVWVSGKTAAIHQSMSKNNDWSDETFQKYADKQLKKMKKIGEKYAHLGIDINKILMKPKVLTEKEVEKSKTKAEKEEEGEKAAGSSKAIKRKTSTTNKVQQKSKKSKKTISLEDLLGNTLPEDSDDEEYVAMISSDEEDNEDGETSDEETYGFTKDSDNEDEDDDDDGDEEEKENEEENDTTEEEDTPIPVATKKIKKAKSFGKSLKSTNVERFDQILERKPHAGGIRKLNKKPLRQPAIGKRKVALQITAAKELAKPLPKVKGKFVKPVKSNKNTRKVK